MTSQLGKQTITIHTLHYTSRSKGYQTMKFGPLIKYNTSNIFLDKSYTKCDRETISRQNQNWVYLWINSLKFCEICFYYMLIWGISKCSETNLQTTCFYLIQRFFLKKKRHLELASLHHFLHGFLRKIFLLLYSINRPNFIVWLSLILEILSSIILWLFVNQAVML